MSTARTRLPALAAAGALTLLLTACGGAAGGAPTSGGTLTVGLGGGATCVDPQQTFNFSSAAMARTVVDSLTDQDPRTGEIRPWLADSWEVNADATEYTFRLREGVTFSDGTPFDAAALAANLDYIKSLGAKSSRGAAYLVNYAGTTVVDPRTAVVSFSAPSAPFLVGTSTLVFGMLSPATTQLTPEQRCQGELVGTGPFVMDSYVQDQTATVLRRAGYAWPSSLSTHQGEAILERIEFVWQPVPNVRAGSLASGQTDVAMSLETQDVAQIEAAGGTVQRGTMPGLPGSFIVNSTRPQLADPAVRQALEIGIDRESVVRTVLGTSFDPATSIVTSNLREYSDMSSMLAPDPARATALLDTAGWIPGVDGIRARDGVRLEIGITYSDDFGAFYTSLMQLVQQQLQAIGIGVRLNSVTQAGLVDAQSTRDFDTLVTTITESDPDIVRSIIQTRSPDTALLESSGLQALFTRQQAESDEAARTATWAEIQRIVLENGIVVPLFEGTQLTGIGPSVTGVRQDFKSMVSFYDTARTE
ncbi:ABC transporter substrate-binding protein [Pseudonocardia xishanensis]|uniref:ABC transporter substrate-binding protein n=1 Tax=Pseudonocardia xishanensis TaxID=630995 RepID=A0ABP8S0M7_9PSEU